MNKIYKVKNPEWDSSSWYDKFDSFVVIATDVSDIKDLISEAHGAYCEDNMPEGWDNDVTKWEFTELGTTELDPQIVLGSFNAA